jgi:hypothetical protein
MQLIFKKKDGVTTLSYQAVNIYNIDSFVLEILSFPSEDFHCFFVASAQVI